MRWTQLGSVADKHPPGQCGIPEGLTIVPSQLSACLCTRKQPLTCVTWPVQAIALLAPVIRKLGARANPGNLKKVPLSAVALWAFYVGALQADRLRLHMLSVCCCSLTSQLLCKDAHSYSVEH